jgi:hypothetical protein
VRNRCGSAMAIAAPFRSARRAASVASARRAGEGYAEFEAVEGFAIHGWQAQPSLDVGQNSLPRLRRCVIAPS